jgi:shikimate kinase
MEYRFIDLDDEIARRADKSIADIFRDEGEAAFRALEAEAVGDVIGECRVVVALGGGVVANGELRARIKEAGLLVCLQVSTDRLTARLSRSAARRPLLKGADGEPLYGDVLRTRIERLLAERQHAYQDAHVTVNVEETSKGKAVDRLKKAIEAYTRVAVAPARSDKPTAHPEEGTPHREGRT